MGFATLKRENHYIIKSIRHRNGAMGVYVSTEKSVATILPYAHHATATTAIMRNVLLVFMQIGSLMSTATKCMDFQNVPTSFGEMV